MRLRGANELVKPPISNLKRIPTSYFFFEAKIGVTSRLPLAELLSEIVLCGTVVVRAVPLAQRRVIMRSFLSGIRTFITYYPPTN